LEIPFSTSSKELEFGEKVILTYSSSGIQVQYLVNGTEHDPQEWINRKP
jgi:hypothetical protein